MAAGSEIKSEYNGRSGADVGKQADAAADNIDPGAQMTNALPPRWGTGRIRRER